MTRRSVCSLLLLGTLSAAPGSAAAQTLEGFATFPADTFAPGPTSGQLITPANGRLPPFEDQQPVQGISSVLAGSHDDFWVMADNGFGAKENSSDFVNDNNYPFSAGRVPGQADPNEFIVIKLDRPLPRGCHNNRGDDRHGRDEGGSR